MVATSAALLLPSYDIVRREAAAKKNELAALSAANASSGASAFAALLAEVNARAAALGALGAAPADLPLLAEVLSVAHPGVALTGFSFSPAKRGAAGSLSISGTAATRDALRAYDLALSAAPFAAAVELPVSSYAAESELPFTLTLTFTTQ
jgi:Tfp pilus assembly protein PilN